jgi:hypothetical protein
MENSRLFIFGPILEFSAFLRFNSFIYRIKEKDGVKITAIVVDSAIDIIQDADDIITISTEYLKRTNSNYPNNLETLGNRNISNFFTIARDYIIDKYNVDPTNILYWHPLHIRDGNNNVRYQDLMNTNGYTTDTSDIGRAYDRDYHFIKQWLSKNNTTKPTEDNFNDIQKKYGHIFTENTVTLITRNFKNKQPQTNTHVMIPNLSNIIEGLTKEDVKVINIGFPPSNFNISENYVEINDELSEGDLISLFYLSKGTILSGANGGYNPHASSNIDIFNICQEFRGDYFISGRLGNKEIASYDLTPLVKSNNIEEIVNTIKNHKKFSKLEFAQSKDIVVLDKILKL